jgi:hypothetical protein
MKIFLRWVKLGVFIIIPFIVCVFLYKITGNAIYDGIGGFIGIFVLLYGVFSFAGVILGGIYYVTTGDPFSLLK